MSSLNVTANAELPQYQMLASLRDIPSYKGVLLDQFGVLHDGIKPFPGAIETVKYLAFDRGMKLLVLSNSSRRSAGALRNLERMGFPVDAFIGVITSGEMTHDALLNRRTDFWRRRSTCIHMTWADRGAISLEGLGVEVTKDPEAADFILAHGTEALGTEVTGSAAEAVPLEHLKEILEMCSKRNLPMVVANPDVVTVHGSELRVMPGTLATWYSDFGGEVHLMGKPAQVIYEGALRMLGLDASEVVAVGDSLEHDIAGAARAGVDALFVGGGIHAVELGVKSPQEASASAGRWDDVTLSALCTRFEAHPRYCIPYFTL